MDFHEISLMNSFKPRGFAVLMPYSKPQKDEQKAKGLSTGLTVEKICQSGQFSMAWLTAQG